MGELGANGCSNLGRCVLCLQERELRKSHYIAAGFFKAVQQGFEPHASAPVLIDAKDNVAFYTNQQATKFLLCSECEAKFADREDKVIRACHGNNARFRLRHRLNKLRPSTVSKDRPVWFGNDLPSEFYAEAYAYFALSVIWRGSVTTWGGTFDQNRPRLGKRFEETFRKFLYGEASFPESVNVNIQVDFDEPLNPLIAFPTFSRVATGDSRFFRHSFMIPGMRILVFVGKSVSEIEHLIPRPAFGHAAFFSWSLRGDSLFGGVASVVGKSKSKGKLANEES